MATFVSDGVGLINVARAGTRGGPPILLLHPVGLDLTWWGEQFAGLVDHHDVLAIDMPGHGLSSPLEGKPTFERLVSVSEQVLDARDGGPAHVVGVSIGGMLAQHLALRRPDLVRTLTLVATLCTFPESVRQALRDRARVARSQGMAKIAELSNERWFPPAFRERRPDVLDRATRSLLAQDAQFHASIWEMIAELNLAEKLPLIACPTLVVAGAEDINAPVGAAETIAGLVRGARLEVMAGVGHFPPFEAPGAFNALLIGFLSEQRPFRTPSSSF